LTVGVQAIGSASEDRILYRSNAKPGDRIYVSGTIGDAGLALYYLKASNEACPSSLRQRLDRPDPRIGIGRSIGGLASACIDISDGFAADLSHLLQASRVGATVDWNRIPLSSTVLAYVSETRDFSLPLCAGDDYELCFTVPAEKEVELIRKIGSTACACRRVGSIDQQPGLRVTNGDSFLDLNQHGYEHFS
jgi:thiamine-monophosphate kinase